MGKLTRQRNLIEMLGDTGQIVVSQAAIELGTSDDTIRRDLVDLDRKGFLHRTHGGAVSIEVGRMARAQRSRLLANEKQRIGAVAAAALQPGMTLLFDAGSTTLAMAAALSVPATVVTNSLDIANVVEGRADVRLILVGGEWDAKQRLFAGAAARDILSMYRADLAILGACAVSMCDEVTATAEGDAELKRAMIKSASETWLLVDHLKFGKTEPHSVAGLDRFSRVFTDRLPSIYEERGLPPHFTIAPQD